MPARTDSYADDTQTPFSAPSPYGVTHDKLTSSGALCNGSCAFAMRFFIGLSPAGNGSNTQQRLALAYIFAPRDTEAPQSDSLAPHRSPPLGAWSIDEESTAA